MSAAESTALSIATETKTKTVEELTAALDKWNGVEISPTAKAVKSVLMEEFGGDFCDEDVETTLDLLEKQAKARKLEEAALAAINPAAINLKDSSKEIVEKVGKLLNTETQFWATSLKSRISHYNPEIGIWEDDGEEKIATRTTEILNSSEEASFMRHIINETIAYIRLTNMHSKQILAGPPEIMVLENGRINIDTGEFYSDFDPDEHHIIRIPVSYDPNAKCPEFDKFLHQVLNTEDDIHAIYELSGYCLFKYAVFDIIIVMVGSGANGKGILQEVLTAFLGEENIISTTLQQLAERPFASAGLHGKLANLAGEIPSTAIKVTEKIKDLTGGNRITGEHKGRDQFSFRPFAVLMFATNNPPQVYDDSDGWWRRFRRIVFHNTFPKGNKNTIPRDELVAKLTTPEELSGLLNKALEGWKRFRKQGKLSGDRGIIRERKEWIRLTDPIKYLCQTFFTKDRQGPELVKKGLYELYLRFCDTEDKNARTDTTFHKNFKRHCGYVSEYKKRINVLDKSGKEISIRVRVYKGLKIDIEKLKAIGVNLEGIEFRPEPDQLTLDEFLNQISTDLEGPMGPIGPTTTTPSSCNKSGEGIGTSRTHQTHRTCPKQAEDAKERPNQSKMKPPKPLPRVVKRFEKWLSRIPHSGQRGFTEEEGIRVYDKKFHNWLYQYVERKWLEQKGESQVWWISDEGKATLAGGSQEERSETPKKAKKKPKRSKKPKLPLVVRKFKKWLSKLPDEFREEDIIRVHGEDFLEDFLLYIGKHYLDKRGEQTTTELQVWGLSKDGEAALEGRPTSLEKAGERIDKIRFWSEWIASMLRERPYTEEEMKEHFRDGGSDLEDFDEMFAKAVAEPYIEHQDERYGLRRHFQDEEEGGVS